MNENASTKIQLRDWLFSNQESLRKRFVWTDELKDVFYNAKVYPSDFKLQLEEKDSVEIKIYDRISSILQGRTHSHLFVINKNHELLNHEGVQGNSCNKSLLDCIYFIKLLNLLYGYTLFREQKWFTVTEYEEVEDIEGMKIKTAVAFNSEIGRYGVIIRQGKNNKIIVTTTNQVQAINRKFLKKENLEAIS